jgi:hypothetical protein
MLRKIRLDVSKSYNSSLAISWVWDCGDIVVGNTRSWVKLVVRGKAGSVDTRHPAGRHSCFVLGRSRLQTSVRRQVFRGFPQLYQENAGIVRPYKEGWLLGRCAVRSWTRAHACRRENLKSNYYHIIFNSFINILSLDPIQSQLREA